MARKTKKKSGRMSKHERLANSAIATASCRLQNAGYQVHGVRHKQLIRMYAEYKYLTIPDTTNLKSWIIFIIKGKNSKLTRKKKNRTLVPSKRTVAAEYAKANKRKMTDEAKKFRTMIRNAKIEVKSEYYIPNPTTFYLIDFYLPSVNMCVEIDGGYHDTPEQKMYDAQRDAYLIGMGYKVVRITNEQMKKFNSVIELRDYLKI